MSSIERRSQLILLPTFHLFRVNLKFELFFWGDEILYFRNTMYSRYV